MEFPVKNRFTGKVQFIAEIECESNASDGFKLGLAVKWALKNGADLRGADLRDVNLRGADLSGANLSDVNLRGAYLSGADLRGADLRDVNLSGAYLSGADLRDVNLRGADLRGVNLSGVPSIENIHKKVYEAASQPDALDMKTWHACETTHCRAGWVVRLAGDAGAAMEYCIGTPAAAALIYLKSDPNLEKVPDFYCSNDEALADMKRLAGD